MKNFLIGSLLFSFLAIAAPTPVTLDLTGTTWKLSKDENCLGVFAEFGNLAFNPAGLTTGKEIQEGRWVTIQNWGMGFSYDFVVDGFDTWTADYIGHVDSPKAMHGTYQEDNSHSGSSPDSPRKWGCWKAEMQ